MSGSDDTNAVLSVLLDVKEFDNLSWHCPGVVSTSVCGHHEDIVVVDVQSWVVSAQMDSFGRYSYLVCKVFGVFCC